MVQDNEVVIKEYCEELIWDLLNVATIDDI